MRVRVLASALALQPDSGKYHRLTSGSEYFVLEVTDTHIRVVSDDGEPILYPKSLFEFRDCRIPPNWQFVAGDDDDYYRNPQRAGMPGFYEDFFGSDGDMQAQASAQRALGGVLTDALEWGDEADRRVVERDLGRLRSRQQNHL